MAVKTKKKELTKRQWTLLVNKLKKEGADNHKIPIVKMGYNKTYIWHVSDSFYKVVAAHKYSRVRDKYNSKYYFSGIVRELFRDTMNSMCLEDQVEFARLVALKFM